MELGIKDRIYIPQMLPEKNSFAEFSLKKSIVGKVAITEKDRTDYEIKEDKEKGMITWNVEKEKSMPLVIEFTKEELAYIKKSCENLIETAYPDDFWDTVNKVYDAN
jgi:vacuolar-type H+-ATPase subunit B/Vma2